MTELDMYKTELGPYQCNVFPCEMINLTDVYSLSHVALRGGVE